MNKQEQIKEMAKDIMSGEFFDYGIMCKKHTCQLDCDCGGYRIAEDLINKNYRKVDENEIVISNDGKHRTDEEIEFFVKHNAEVRKQIAKEIITYLRQFDGYANIAAEELAKKYGVEIDK